MPPAAVAPSLIWPGAQSFLQLVAARGQHRGWLRSSCARLALMEGGDDHSGEIDRPLGHLEAARARAVLIVALSMMLYTAGYDIGVGRCQQDEGAPR